MPEALRCFFQQLLGVRGFDLRFVNGNPLKISAFNQWITGQQKIQSREDGRTNQT